jgi:sec-independent protein translocase protein TatC
MSRLRPVGHDERLSLVEHLDELRTRLIYCILVLVAAFSVCY